MSLPDSPSFKKPSPEVRVGALESQIPSGTHDLFRLLRCAVEVTDSLDALEHELPDGTVIGDFTVLRKLAYGGMGVVYLARQRSPARDLALKVLPPSLNTASSLRRFEDEADTLATLEHPNIARVVASGIAASPNGCELAYIAMEYVCEARDIVSYCNERSLSAIQRAELFTDCLKAIEFAHFRGIVHCDIKPSNVLVSGEGLVKVIDFGVARALSADSKKALTSSWYGTIEYAAPESLRSGTALPDLRSDVYSLGLLLAELWLLERPRHLTAPSKDWTSRLRTTVRHRARAAGHILQRALQPDPDLRYQSVIELRTDLERWRDGRELSGRGVANLLSAALHRVSEYRWPLLAAVAVIAVLYLALSSQRLQASATEATEENERLLHQQAIRDACRALSIGSPQWGMAESLLRKVPASRRDWTFHILAGLGSSGPLSFSIDGVPTAACLLRSNNQILVGDERGYVSLHGFDDIQSPKVYRLSESAIRELYELTSTVLAIDANGRAFTIDPSSGYSRGFDCTAAAPYNENEQLLVVRHSKLFAIGERSGEVAASLPAPTVEDPLLIRLSAFDGSLASITRKSGMARLNGRGPAAMIAEGMGRVHDLRWLGPSELLLLTATNGPIVWRSGVTSPLRLPALSADRAAYSESTGRLALGTSKGDLLVSHWPSLSESRRLPAHSGAVTFVTIAHDGRTIATGGDDGVIRIWSDEALTRGLARAPSSPAYRLFATSNNGEYIAHCNDSAVVHAGRSAPPSGDRAIVTPGVLPNSLAINDDGGHVLLGLDTDCSWLVSTADGSATRLHQMADDCIASAFVDLHRFVVLTGSGRLSLLEIGRDDPVWTCSVEQPLRNCSRHGSRIAPQADGTVAVFLGGQSLISVVADVATGELLSTVLSRDLGAVAVSGTYSPQHRTWCIVDNFGNIRRVGPGASFDSPDSTCRIADGVVDLDMSPNGDVLVAASRAGVLTFVSILSMETLGSLTVAAEAVGGLTILRPSGEIVIPLARGELLRLKPGEPPREVRLPSFSPEDAPMAVEVLDDGGVAPIARATGEEREDRVALAGSDLHQK